MEVFYKSNTIINIIELFKIFSQFGNKKLNSINISYIDSYLASIVSNKTRLEYLDYYKFQIETDLVVNKENIIIDIQEKLQNIHLELGYEQKYRLYISLFDFSHFLEDDTNKSKIQSLLEQTYTMFHLNRNVIRDIECFCRNNIDLIQKKENIIVVGNFKRIKPKSFSSYHCNFLNGNIYTYYIEQINTFIIQYFGSDNLTLYNLPIFPNRTYQLFMGNIIEGENIKPIFFNDLVNKIHTNNKNQIFLNVKGISKIFKKTNLGIHPATFNLYSGELLAIMGGSGSGKTTLLNLLCGNLLPDSGQIFINGLDFGRNKKELRKHIGFVPQDDLLIEELTVYQNLLFNTKLCRDDLNLKEQIETCLSTLKGLDLLHIKNLRVGNALNQVISGGQRKRLNIAIELVRNPSIIYLDEPTSGLSSSDAFSVINLLKRISLSGKIVIVNIHQPSSDIFHLFDKLLILDKKGYTTYFGNPVWASKHFKKHLNFEDTPIDDSIKFGHCSPERIINLMEYKTRDNDGNLTDKRIYSEKQWNNIFLLDHKINDIVEGPKIELPEAQTQKPSSIKQFLIFISRNFRTRITDNLYVLLLLLSSPVLALMMSVFLKSTDIETHEYWFINNDNIPTYLFISVIISIFQGLVTSSGEIYRDLSLLKREALLDLNPFAYLNSKLLYLFSINAYQTAIYVLVANSILEIKGLFSYYFLVLWVTSNTSSLIGLYISSRFKSILSIYITIPFILIPKILLAGAILNFDKIHHSLASEENVPIYANLTVSRWAYEGLVNIQFAKNEYESQVYDNLILKSSIQYQLYFVLPILKTETNNLNKTINDKEKDINIIRNIFSNLTNEFPTLKKNISIKDIDFSNPDIIKNLTIKTEQWLKKIQQINNARVEEIRVNANIDKRKYYNRQLAEFAMNSNDYINYLRSDESIIRKYQPCFFVSQNKFGRSHYYAPYKNIGDFRIATWIFNIYILLIYSSILYLLVLFRLLKIKE